MEVGTTSPSGAVHKLAHRHTQSASIVLEDSSSSSLNADKRYRYIKLRTQASFTDRASITLKDDRNMPTLLVDFSPSRKWCNVANRLCRQRQWTSIIHDCRLKRKYNSPTALFQAPLIKESRLNTTFAFKVTAMPTAGGNGVPNHRAPGIDQYGRVSTQKMQQCKSTQHVFAIHKGGSTTKTCTISNDGTQITAGLFAATGANQYRGRAREKMDLSAFKVSTALGGCGGDG